ncbi:MAG: M28 family peptidase [Sphingomonadales bacterium]|nr:MAG: M28 family peptidase [Sphingomonadales bacterium]
MRHALTALLLLASGTASAQSISLDTIKEITRTLSSDEYEGRAPTTPAEEKTLATIVDRMKAAGLQPGNKGSWFQEVPLVELTAQNVSNLAITGGKTPLSLAYRTDMVIGTYRVVPRIEIKNSDIVFVGYGINAPERGWNDYAGLNVKGKTVVILVNDPDWENPNLEGPFNGKAMTYYGRWTYKYEEAARQGAAAALIVHDSAPAAYGWGVVQSSWTGPQLQQDVPGDKNYKSLGIGWITNDTAKALFASAGKDLPSMQAAAKTKGFKAVPLGMKASVSWDNAIKRQSSKNVVGILPGKTRPDEVVLYTAHWDHLGRCDAVDGDDICNGAVDNASGIGALVALAEAHSKAGAPARSLVFLAVTAEESGLLGSKFYAENPVYPLAKTVGGVNMDSLNTFGKTNDFVIVGAGKSELEDLVKPFVAAEGRVIIPEQNPQGGGYYRSDHFSFAKLGVPMLSAGSGSDLVKGGKEAGAAARADYSARRYHKPQDEYDANWDWSGALSDLNIYFAMGRALAESETWPNWYPNAEFRGIRDKSRAGEK